MSRKKLLPVLFLFSTTFIFSACFSPMAGIPILGLDENGEPIELEYSEEDYSKGIEQLMVDVYDSAAPALADVRENPSWKLRTVVFGIGFQAGVSLGDIWGMEASQKFRFAFSNGTKPVIP